MTVSTTIIKNSHSGNGSVATFAYQFRIIQNSDLVVLIRNDTTGTETQKTLTSQYTVSGAGDATGGSITFTVGNIPANGETVVIRRNVPQTQAIDYIANDPFPAETHEEGLDRGTMVSQQVSEATDRSIKLSRTNTMTSTEFTVGATARASKVLGFDANGELAVTQELGTYKGNWSTATAYLGRDIIKDTSNNNIYLCNTAHTSSGSQPISSNTDAAKWDLLVDAASATTSAATATTQAGIATTKATAAANSANAAAASETAAETAETAAETAQTAAETAKTAAETAYDNFDDRYLGAKSSDPSVDNDGNALITGALYFNSSSNVMKNYTGSAWETLKPTSTEQTNINTLAAADVVSDMNTLATADIVADMNTLATADVVADMNTLGTADVVNDMNVLGTSATVTAMNLLGTSTNVTNMDTCADNLAGINSFAERYRVTAGNPGSNNDVGDLNFNTSSNTMMVYGSSGWQSAGSSVNGTSARYNYTATANQTTFSGADANGNTLAYDAGYVDVYLNGVKLLNGTDVTVTSGNSVVLASGAAVNDIVDIVGFGTFNVAAIDGSAITTGTINEARLPASALGAVWESKSASFTAAARKNYFCDTSSNAIDVTLPSGTIGDEIHFLDVAGTFDTNDLTLLAGSGKIQGVAANLDVSTERAGFSIVYYNI